MSTPCGKGIYSIHITEYMYFSLKSLLKFLHICEPFILNVFHSRNLIFAWRGVFAFLRYLHPHFGCPLKSIANWSENWRMRLFDNSKYSSDQHNSKFSYWKYLLFEVFSQLIISTAWSWMYIIFPILAKMTIFWRRKNIRSQWSPNIVKSCVFE